MSFNDLRPSVRLPPPPSGTKPTLIFVEGDQERAVVQKTKDGAQIYSECSVSDEVESVSVIPTRYKEDISPSPTRLYAHGKTNLYWSRGDIDKNVLPAYDQVCYGGDLLISRFLQPFREASQRGGLGMVSISDLNKAEKNEAIKLVKEYGFYTTQQSLKEKLNEKKVEEVGAIIFQHGSLMIRGVDLDLNQQLDVLVAQNVESGVALFLYDLERSPKRIQQSIPSIAAATVKKEGEPEIVAKADRPKARKQPKREPKTSGRLAVIPEETKYSGRFRIKGEEKGVRRVRSIPPPPYPVPKNDLPLEDGIGYLMLFTTIGVDIFGHFSGELELRYRPHTDDNSYVVKIQSLLLPVLPKDREWDLKTLRMEEVVWDSLDRGRAPFSIESVSESRERYLYSFNIPFTRIPEAYSSGYPSTRHGGRGVIYNYLSLAPEATLVSVKKISSE